MGVKNITIEEVVTKIGRDLNRTEQDISKECEKLHNHWIVTLYDWFILSEERKNLVGLPVMLNTKIEQFINSTTTEEEESDEICYIIQRNSKSITILINKVVYEFHLHDTIEDIQKLFGKECYFQTKEKLEINSTSKITYVIIPGNRIYFNNSFYVFYSAYNITAIDNWLHDIKMIKYTNQFKANDLEDFLILPFLKMESLESMGIVDENDRNIIYNSITDMLNLSHFEFAGHWLKYLGFENAPEICVNKEIDLNNLLLVKDAKFFIEAGFDQESSHQLWQIIEKYKKFSSVEETFQWLRANSFDKYSFHFARYNIPFYALPFVNFFIINEMGVTIDDQQLLSALQELKDSPTYNAKAVTFWLRDLEMEYYNLRFAKNKFCSLENYTTLDDRSLEKFIQSQHDKERMKTGIREMKEFQFYYTATSSLLQELGMEKYSQLFALHGISIDVLPLLTEPHLIEMGITKVADRKRILSVIQKIKDFIPSNDDSIINDRLKARRQLNTINNSNNQPKANINNNNRTPPEDSRTVEEWLSFINDGSRPVVIKKSDAKHTNNSNKKSKKKKKKSKKVQRTTPSSSPILQNSNQSNTMMKIEELELEIVSELEKSNPKKKVNPKSPNLKPSTNVSSSSSSSSTKQQSPKSPNLKPQSPKMKPQNQSSSKLGNSPSLSSVSSNSSISTTNSSPSTSSSSLENPTKLKSISTPLLSDVTNNTPSLSSSSSPYLSSKPISIPNKMESPIIELEDGSPTALEKDFFSLEDDEMDPEIMAMLDAEVEEFRKRLESASTKSKLVPIFYLPD